MDRLVDKIVGLGVPGLVLLIAISATGYAGAAAITAALAALGGPFGMLGGIAMLIFLALLSRGVAEYGFEAIYVRVLERIKEDQNMSEQDIIDKINSYPISKGMKAKLIAKMKSVK